MDFGNRKVKQAILAAAALAWFCGVAGGLAMMAGFANRPGATGQAPARWPSDSVLTRDASGPTLVMLAHPQCDCTRASLTELAELMARSPHRPKAFVVFIQPRGMGDDWQHSAVWRDASRIPNVTVVRDDDGREARRFGAETSGQTLLYDREARLLFSGGTTESRGHVGDNRGFEALVSLLAGRAPREATASVFGCSLFAPRDAARNDGRPDGS